MRTLILMVVSFLAGVYCYKYREGLKSLIKKLWDKIFGKKEDK
jgi:hypothetical protein